MTGPAHKQKSEVRADHRRCVESGCVMTRWTGLLGIRSAQRLCAEMAERTWSAEKGQARQRALSQPGTTNARAACWERAARVGERACRAGFGETARRLRAGLTRCARQSFPVACRGVVTAAAVNECVSAPTARSSSQHANRSLSTGLPHRPRERLSSIIARPARWSIEVIPRPVPNIETTTSGTSGTAGAAATAHWPDSRKSSRNLGKGHPNLLARLCRCRWIPFGLHSHLPISLLSLPHRTTLPATVCA